MIGGRILKETMDKNQRQLLEALEYANERNRNYREKEEKKIWSEISTPLSLHDGLSRYTKSDLDEIRKRYDISGASSLKKADLMNLLEEQLPLLARKLVLLLDEERFSIIRKVLNQGGTGPAPKLEFGQYKYLQSLGFIFTGTINGQQKLIIPNEMIEPLTSLAHDIQIKAALKRNTEWIQLTKGMLYYYGIKSSNGYYDTLKKNSTEEIPYSEYFNVLYQAADYYPEMDYDYNGIYHYRVDDPKRLKEEQQMRITIDYYPFSKQELLAASEPNFVEKNEYYKRFAQFIYENFQYSRKEAEDLATECVHSFQEGIDFNQYFGYFSNKIVFESMDAAQECADILVKLYNNTRQWHLKGYSPTGVRIKNQNIMSPVAPRLLNNQNQKTVKVGRNDPCPCGSGRKYKKCCGR